jgi:5-methylcytosine-specific restriction endonuclease McrA
VRVEFTARAELYDKLEKARELLSHAVPSGDLGELFERALDALLERETRKRSSTQAPRKARPLEPGSRHVPRSVERAVWERDGWQCTHLNEDGLRCCERRFLTLEHRIPLALGGPPTLDNLCLLCRAHNLENARQVFGERHMNARIRAAEQQPHHRVTDRQVSPSSLDTAAKVHTALCQLGFRRAEASVAIAEALGAGPGLDAEQLLRACLLRLLPKAS